MHYTSQYPSPLGELLLAADDDGLTGVWFVGQKYFARSLAPDSVAREIPLFAQVKQWLALYFAGQEPELEIPIHMVGTAFQKAVWRILRTIPYGQTMTYGEIARRMADIQKVPHMSAHDLWRHCPAGGGGAGYPADVPPGGGGRSGTQSNFHPYPMPPGGGDQRQPDGIRRRAGPESQIVDLGKSGGGFPLPAQKRNRPVK